MERYESRDGRVLKYVHADGSETAVKTTAGCGKHAAGNRKVTIFASISSGCFMRCGFCWLTAKNVPFHPLAGRAVMDNVTEAFHDAARTIGDIRHRYLKLSWMGMGEPWPLIASIPGMTAEILERIVSPGLVAGVDGVDIGTVLPEGGGQGDREKVEAIAAMGRTLAAWPVNPDKTGSPARIMVSLHSPSDAARSTLLPGCSPISRILSVAEMALENKVDIVAHYTLAKGINDSPSDATGLARLLDSSPGIKEIRFLVLNRCSGTDLSPTEANDRAHFARRLAEAGIDPDRIRIQVSAGSEIKAACGQFLAKEKDRLAAGK